MADETDADDATTPDPEDPDAAILEAILEDYEYDVLNWADIRKEADIDVQYAANNTWNADDTQARAGRPMLNLDQLSQYRNQVENTVRQNKRGVKVSPAGNGATEETATLRANRIREIEYQSHAQEAYSQAFSDCLTRSYGFARIVAEYEDEDTDNQVFRTRSIPNPNQVIPDSDAQSTSGRDWTRCVFVDSLSHAAFKRDYPDAQIRDFDADTIAKSNSWVTDTRVQVAECWRVTETPNPRGKGKPIREVCMYLTNGLELLAKAGEAKKHPWKGKYIPFASCYGRIIYTGTSQGDTQKLMLSYIRFARDGAKGYNWTKSTILEKIALPVKASLMGYKGQADVDTLALIARATQEHVPWLEFNPVTDATGTTVLPLPQYGTREPDIQADLLVAEGFQRDIQNALGHFNAQDARLGTSKVTSGLALQELKRSGDLGSFDFQDHYDDFLKFLGEQYDDLLTHYDDAAKEVATRHPDDTIEMVRINTPTARGEGGVASYGPKDVRMDQGRHTITISTGPSSDSQREAGKEAAMALLGNPQAFPIIAADGVRLMDLGPIGDQMAEDLEYLQPPVMQQARQQKKDGGAPDPRQLQQQLDQLKQQLQHLEQVAQEMDGQLKGKQAEIASKEKIEMARLDFDAKKAAQESEDKRADREVKLAVAELGAKTKETELFYEERARVGLDEQAAIARSHEYVMHQEKIASAKDIAAASHQNKLDATAQAARASRSVNFTKDPETGAVVSATITGDPGADPGADDPGYGAGV